MNKLINSTSMRIAEIQGLLARDDPDSFDFYWGNGRLATDEQKLELMRQDATLSDAIKSKASAALISLRLHASHTYSN